MSDFDATEPAPDATTAGGEDVAATPRKPGPPPGTGGRPARARAAFDPVVFEALLRVRATEQEVLDEFRISERSLIRSIRRHYGRAATFAELSRRFSANTRLSLRRRVLSAGMRLNPDGTVHDPAMLRHAHTRFDPAVSRVEVATDPAQHDEAMAAQSAATDAALEQRERESMRVESVLQLLAKAITKPPR